MRSASSTARAPLGEFAYERELRDLAAAGLIELKQTVTREVGAGRLGRHAQAESAAPISTPLVAPSRDAVFHLRACGGSASQDMLAALTELGVARRSESGIEEWELASVAESERRYQMPTA